MAKTKAVKKFRISLVSSNGSGPRDVVVAGQRMDINHRGDLMILESVPSYGNYKCIAAFRTGIWTEAVIDEEPTV